MSSLCDKITDIDGFKVLIECSTRRSISVPAGGGGVPGGVPGVPGRRRLADIQLTTLASGCYKNEGDTSTLDACDCHDSCKACGFGDAPTEHFNCLSCSNPAHELTFEPGEKFGKCLLPAVPAKPDGCYKEAGDTTPIDDCKCHESCKTCGYNENPTLSTECLTCVDLDHIFFKGDDVNGRCTLPSTGTVELVASPTNNIYEHYKEGKASDLRTKDGGDCNQAYYEYREYNGCDNYLASNFDPIHIFDSKNENRIIELNKVYSALEKKKVRDKGVREESSKYREYVRLLELREADLANNLRSGRSIPRECQASANWLATNNGDSPTLSLNADSCFIMTYSGWLSHS